MPPRTPAAMKTPLPPPSAQVLPRAGGAPSAMVPLHVGWRSYGQPVLGVALKLWASQRLDVAVAITCTTLWPAVGGAVGVAVARVARVLVASRAARSAERRRKAGGSIEESEDKEEVEAAAPLRGTGSAREGRVPQAPKGMAGMGLPPARPPTLPPVVLPPVPPGGLAACSAQSVGLPMMLVGQSAARAPLYAVRVDRLRRGLAGLAATLLLCRRAAAGRGWCGVGLVDSPALLSQCQGTCRPAAFGGQSDACHTLSAGLSRRPSPAAWRACRRALWRRCLVLVSGGEVASRTWLPHP